MKLGTLTPSFRLGSTTPSRIYLGVNLVWESAFNPLSLAPALWLSDTGANPAQWDDISGNGRHAVQATPERQPSIVDEGMSGRQVRRFGGIESYMLTPSLPGMAGLMSVFVVLKCVSGISNDYVLTFANSNSNAIIAGWTANLEIFQTPRLSIGPNPTSPTIATVIRNSATPNTSTWSNGTLRGTGGSTQTTGAGTVWVGSGVAGAAPYDGDIAEILIFPTALSTADRQAVENYLNAKWAIY